MAREGGVLSDDVIVQLLYFQDIMSMISSRIPSEVENSIRDLMKSYMSNLTSILSQFPSQQVGARICYIIACVLQNSIDNYKVNTLCKTVQKYHESW